jgi:hypothetical protein
LPAGTVGLIFPAGTFSLIPVPARAGTPAVDGLAAEVLPRQDGRAAKWTL